MTRIIDLSVTISPMGQLKVMPDITYVSHKGFSKEFATLGGLDASDFRNGMLCGWERICMPIHQGTHLDAPWHFGCTGPDGQPAKTIEKWPLEWCYGDGVVLDFHTKERGSGITPEDLEAELKRIGYKLKPLDIVLIRTDSTKHYNEKNYEYLGPGVTKEATIWLIDQGIKVTGIDAFTWDKPFDCVLTQTGKQPWPTPDSLPGYDKVPPAPETGNLDEFFESHYLGMEKEYVHAENLANLDKLPPFGFKIALFPVKVEGGSGGWARAAAILDD